MRPRYHTEANIFINVNELKAVTNGNELKDTVDNKQETLFKEDKNTESYR